MENKLKAFSLWEVIKLNDSFGGKKGKRWELPFLQQSMRI